MSRSKTKILFLLLLKTAISISSFSAEKDSLTFEHQIHWNHEQAVYPEKPFEGLGFWEDSTGLLIYRIEIPLPPQFNDQDYQIKVRKRQWAPFSGKVNDMTPADVTRPIVNRVTYIKKQPYLEIEMIPYRISTNQDIQWDKLTQLSLSVIYRPQSPKADELLKSNRLKYRTASRLSGGKWIKISTNQAGIHTIPYSTLSSWGFSNPANVRLFGQGGQMVPMNNQTPRPDDLPEMSAWHHNNALYFYSSGTTQWQWNEETRSYDYYTHRYSPLAYFFVTEGQSPPDEPMTAKPCEGEPLQSFTTFDFLYLHEQELENILKSGNQWFGERFSTTEGLERTFNIEGPLLLTDSSALLTTRVVGRANTSQSFTVTVNDGVSTNIPLSTVTLSDYIGYYARMETSTLPFTPPSDNLQISFRYNNQQSTSTGWLDYFIISAKARLTLNGNQLIFRNHQSVGVDHISTFSIESEQDELELWDVTLPGMPLRHALTKKEGNRFEFKDSTKTLKTYVIFDPSKTFPQPGMVEEVKNQNLHGTGQPEMVIVTPTTFIEQASRLAALHAKYSGLSSVVVEREQLYNEFSWGHPDPGAIRSFLKMLYDRADGEEINAPQLLLLFGDGSYDNRSIVSTPPAPLPTYQSENSIYQTRTYVSDDFYGLLDDNEGADLQNDRLDIGIGRLPVNTEKEATNAVDKIETYLTQQSQGKWKTKLTFVGDDEDFNIHMNHAEQLTNLIDRNQPFFDITKIYLDAYKATSTSTGKEFPDARMAIERAISEGTLIFNYTGHGSENNLAHEQIITKSDINGWRNLNKLPLFVTATCEFSRFDNHELTSAGEEVFLNPNGGAIALLSTTRIVYSSLNFTLNQAFCNHVFETDNQNQPLPLGEIMRRTKLESGSSINKLSFTLLGDPALRLIYPTNKVVTQSVNSHTALEGDTLKALSENTITGILTDPAGNIMNHFNGELELVVYDKAVETQTLGNNNNEPFEYREYANILFKGRSSVKEGHFSSSFVIPRDIRYNYGPGRINYYAVSDEGDEASGAYDEIIIGGIVDNSKEDTQGPELKLYLNHLNFNTGDQTGNRPILYVEVFDQSGINTSGIGIGHDITLVIDNNTQSPLILNDAFTFTSNSYQKGMIVYQLPELSDGVHEITIKVWDTYNNSSVASTFLNSSSDRNLKLREFTVYPNPVDQSGTVYATITSDEPNTLFYTTIDFIDARGRITGSDTQKLIANGNLIGPFKLPLEKSGWNKPEICFVRLTLTNAKGKEAVVVKKLLPAP